MNRFVFTICCFLAAAVPAGAQNTSREHGLAGLIQTGNRTAALETIRGKAGAASVNEAQPDGATPLHWAVYRVDYELVEALLARGAKPNAATEFGSTPLAEAVKLADARLVRLLLDAGAKVDTPNEDGQTELMLAVRSGNLPVVELLVRAGANVNAIEKWRGQTPLMWASAVNAPDVVKFLIAKGADVHLRAVQNDYPSQITSEPRSQFRPTGGLTALLYAARAGCKGCVEALLDAGADINKPTPDGVTPLIMAIDNGGYEAAKLLLERGANPNIWDWWGRTPLYVSVDLISRSSVGSSDATKGLDLVKTLLAAGVNPNPQLTMHRPSRGGNNGRFGDDLLNTGATPLLRAAQTRDIEVMRELLAHGALVDLPNAMGVTPFMAASGVGFGEVNRDTSGNRPGGPQATMDFLLQAGADVNARITDTSSYTGRIARQSSMTDRQGQTALFMAAQSGRADLVRYLLDHGARVDVVDDMGRTALDAGSGNAGGRPPPGKGLGSEEVRTMLRNAGSKSN